MSRPRYRRRKRAVHGVEERNPQLAAVSRHHHQSFNFFTNEGLSIMCDCLDPLYFEDKYKNEIKLEITNLQVAKPLHEDGSGRPLFPTECREAHLTYNAPLIATLQWQVKTPGGLTKSGRLQKSLGRIPIMTLAEKCNLHGMSGEELVQHNEDANEPGGIFISRGLEKIIRMVIMPRRNYPMCSIRSNYMQNGPEYSQYACTVRTVRRDESSSVLALHYLKSGNIIARFVVGNRAFFVPVVILLKSLRETTDREIYNHIVRRDGDDTFLTQRVEIMLREAMQFGATTPPACLRYLGKTFRVVMANLPPRLTDGQVGQRLLSRFLLLHLSSPDEKYDFLVFMIRKLYALVRGDIVEDNPDSTMHQEVLLSGHLYMIYVKDQLERWLNSWPKLLNSGNKVRPHTDAEFSSLWDRTPDVGRGVDYFIATGNLKAGSTLGLLQTSGFCVPADKINFLMYISKLQSVHRGQYFTTMPTTSVRKLLPESWGFLCPVHTPDGAPCGLLLHLSSGCHLVPKPDPHAAALPDLLASLGMGPVSSSIAYPKDYLAVVMDGRVLGFVAPAMAGLLESRLRYMKATGREMVPPSLEIVLVTPDNCRLYPGLYLFSTPGRMMRPVKYLPVKGATELVGTFEQVFLDVACSPEDMREGVAHAEIKVTEILSPTANLTPFSDFNQSPRNMYQCQMGKQTMGTPAHNFGHRTDNKLYRLQTPQRPIVRTKTQSDYAIDEFPHGTNAVVAVISYTGYDMEDAMIVNKSAFERGFGHASVYKTQLVDLSDTHRSRTKTALKVFFDNPVVDESTGERRESTLDPDGLPRVGTKLEKGDPLYCSRDDVTGEFNTVRYKGKEPCIVDEVRMLGLGTNEKGPQRASIKLRYNRNPIIGDKFSSRHGQKGIMSRLWPQIDMPFSESGLTPDVIINPHAFPSRMTIGMLIESMAGKSGALHGITVQDATPFQFNEDQRAVDFFGEQLSKAGYNYYGNEVMYSGITGEQFPADIFFGVVYYQRLRHMVSDKYQVRATGPVSPVTRQPVKGRKRGGGIRFGEMERDSMLAHGTSFTLHDRLFNCSDKHKAFVCRQCGSVLSPIFRQPTADTRTVSCLSCETGDGIVALELPYVFRYLVNELAAMNIKLSLRVQ